jgi:hypothetical protein
VKDFAGLKRAIHVSVVFGCEVSKCGPIICEVIWAVIRFDSIRFDSMRFNSIQFDSIQFPSSRNWVVNLHIEIIEWVFWMVAKYECGCVFSKMKKIGSNIFSFEIKIFKILIKTSSHWSHSTSSLVLWHRIECFRNENRLGKQNLLALKVLKYWKLY